MNFASFQILHCIVSTEVANMGYRVGEVDFAL
jgi:hypothetical protein